ncbi:hypothetical protein PFMC_03426 [Plasmodium falciparum CAMP/Malaysia]|uniref:Uncharacterized protein n=1 Tax=Plasmodium falciparum (isolate Camp / Malaysia) TaxID=5835 RepID=A0A024X7E4_PLAFC|nr:hypothetical protein PFMC_03426 [Plasmodium falciparum CAMP/Malaysia]
MNLNKISVLLKIIIFKNTLYIFDNVCTSIHVNDLGYKVSDTINSFKYKKNYDNSVVLDKVPDTPLDNNAKLSFQELLRKRSSDDDDDNDDEGDNDDDDDDNDNNNNNNNNNNNMNRFYNMASIQPAAFNNISQNGNQSFTARMKQNLSKYNPFKKSGSNNNGKVNNTNENVDEDNNDNVDDNNTKKKHRHIKHKSQGTLSNDGSNNMNNNNVNNNNVNNNNVNNNNVNNNNVNNNNVNNNNMINNNMNNNNMNNNNMNNNNMNNINVNNSNMNNNINNNMNNNNNVNASNILLGASALTGAAISGQNQNGINNNQNVVNNNTNNGTIQNSIMLNNSSSIFSNLFENNNKFNTSEMICSSINCTSINSQNNDKIPLTDCSNVLYCGNCPFSSSPKDQCANKNEVSKRLFRLANLYLYTTKFVEDNNNNPLKISINFNNINIDSLKPTEQLANECNSLLPCPLNIAEIKTYNIHATQSLVLYQRLFIPEIYNALNTSNIMINITSDPGYNVANYFFYVKIDCAKTNDIIENEIYPTATLPQTNQQTTQQLTQQTIPQTPIENNPQQNETKNGTPPKNDTSVQLLKNNTSSKDSRRGYSYRNSSHSIIFIFSIITYILFL